MSSLKDGAIYDVPLLVADFKLTDFEKAENESVQYCRHVLNKLSVANPILSMPSSKDKFTLCLCIPISTSLEEATNIALIEICSCKTTDVTCFAHFLHATKYTIALF